ncbi:hypothetical protein IGI04_000657 [Brassica rapa subsp. trilocularis]|uniref:Transmembrane protein n=1 Tax=Brassica rapa subsp. trilocularis TaxID=1813537 RepID=A0ABQ7NQE8_BRACM|nr:hypothetical protein IGI04_000657 [Brassica rapa subsp. trilocularis]
MMMRRSSLALYSSLIMFLLLISRPLPISSHENHGNTAQTLMTTSWRRGFGQNRESLRIFIRKGGRGGGGGGKGRGLVPKSASTRPYLSITFGFGSTVTSLILFMFFTF